MAAGGEGGLGLGLGLGRFARRPQNGSRSWGCWLCACQAQREARGELPSPCGGAL